jgi:hypothetical protein
MRALSAAEIIRVWEDGYHQRVAERALTILEAAFPDATRDSLAALSLGRRDERLLSLHRIMFGRELEASIACPQCTERLEFTFDTSRIGIAPMPSRDELEVAWQGDVVRFRLPDSSDWIAAAECADVASAHSLLVERCVIAANPETIDATPLPKQLLDRVTTRIEECDPHAELQLELECPRCARQWTTVLDVALFLWKELATEAQRLLAEVHALASVYGWRESDILAMSDVRRVRYLEMVS